MRFRKRGKRSASAFPDNGNLRTIALTIIVVLTVLRVVLAQSHVMSPSKSIDALGVPPIPASLVHEIQPYMSIYGLPLAGWDDEKREIRLKALSSATWISRVKSPSAVPEMSSIYIQSSGIYDVYFQPQGKYLAYTKDESGNESFQLYSYEIGTRKTTLLSDGKSRNTEPVWSNAGDKIVYSSTPSGSTGVNLHLLNSLEPKSDHLLARSSGSYFKAYDWSPDDKQVVYCDFTSNTISTLWLVDVANGARALLSPKAAKSELYDSAQFSKDGKGIYVVTDHDSDFRRLAYIELGSLKISYVPSLRQWDVDEFQIASSSSIISLPTQRSCFHRQTFRL